MTFGRQCKWYGNWHPTHIYKPKVWRSRDLSELYLWQYWQVHWALGMKQFVTVDKWSRGRMGHWAKRCTLRNQSQVFWSRWANHWEWYSSLALKTYLQATYKWCRYWVTPTNLSHSRPNSGKDRKQTPSIIRLLQIFASLWRTAVSTALPLMKLAIMGITSINSFWRCWVHAWWQDSHGYIFKDLLGLKKHT